MFLLAAIMVGVAILLVVIGAALVTWGSDGVVPFGWITLGWGLGGLGSALILAIRAWRR
jgi:hypothetical protein